MCEFKDDLVFEYKNTGKNYMCYVDNQNEIEMYDYLGNVDIITDKTAICLFPCNYTLGKSLEYCNLLTDASSKRAVFKEGN